MKLGKQLSRLTLPELEAIKTLSNFNAEELEVFNLLARGESIVAIAGRLNISQGTVSNRIQDIRCKVNKVVKMIEL